MKTKRVILKISGELFQSPKNNIDFDKYDKVAKQLIEIVNKTEVQLAIVVGGGNIFRGREASDMVDSNEADSMGMLSTIINGIGLREALARNGAFDTRLMTSVRIPNFAEPYIRLKGRHHLDNHRIVIIAGGLGMPNFSTDSAVAQYADELKCQMILKASTIDGVYSDDPKKNKSAKKYNQLTFQDALDQNLRVMDKTAFAMCEKSNIPIFVFDIQDLSRIDHILDGDYSFGTIVK